MCLTIAGSRDGGERSALVGLLLLGLGGRRRDGGDGREGGEDAGGLHFDRER